MATAVFRKVVILFKGTGYTFKKDNAYSEALTALFVRG